MSTTSRVLNTFHAILPIYQKTDVMDTPEGLSITLGAKMFAAYSTMSSSPIYIIDDKNIIHSKKTSLPITHLEKDIGDIFGYKEREYILAKVQKDPRIEEFDDIEDYVYGTTYSFNDATINRWVDINTEMPTEEYKTLINDILMFKADQKDPTLVKVNKASIPMGFVMRYQPHTILITPPNAGKTAFYDIAGKRIDKATRNTLLGGAKWTDDKAYGLFHEQYYALTIEQVESQNIENLIGFLLSFLESGKANVAGGGTEMTVIGACPLVITANPLELTGSHSGVLREIIQHLCRNSYAIGRRFGILAYGDYLPIIDKSGTYDPVEHKALMDIYRALEERATNSLVKFWAHPKVREFCGQPVYDREVYDKILNTDVVEVRSFLLAHYAHSFPHIRGAGINMAIVDNLPRLAMNDILFLGDFEKTVNDILEQAKGYTEEIKAVNLASIEYALS